MENESVSKEVFSQKVLCIIDDYSFQLENFLIDKFKQYCIGRGLTVGNDILEYYSKFIHNHVSNISRSYSNHLDQSLLNVFDLNSNLPSISQDKETFSNVISNTDLYNKLFSDMEKTYGRLLGDDFIYNFVSDVSRDVFNSKYNFDNEFLDIVDKSMEHIISSNGNINCEQIMMSLKNTKRSINVEKYILNKLRMEYPKNAVKSSLIKFVQSNIGNISMLVNELFTMYNPDVSDEERLSFETKLVNYVIRDFETNFPRFNFDLNNQMISVCSSSNDNYDEDVVINEICSNLRVTDSDKVYGNIWMGISNKFDIPRDISEEHEVFPSYMHSYKQYEKTSDQYIKDIISDRLAKVNNKSSVNANSSVSSSRR